MASRTTNSSDRQGASEVPQQLSGTKLQIVEAALETLKTKGYSGASAREIARTGDFNQALIFYHFGSVRDLLLAVIDETSARRMELYRPVFEKATTLPELAELAKRIYRDDVEKGYITVLGEVVAGGVADPELGPGVVARMQPWVDMTEAKSRELLAGSPFADLIEPGDLAFGLIALYLGMDMLTHLEGDRSRAESLLELGTKVANLVAAFLPQTKGSGEQK